MLSERTLREINEEAATKKLSSMKFSLGHLMDKQVEWTIVVVTVHDEGENIIWLAMFSKSYLQKNKKIYRTAEGLLILVFLAKETSNDPPPSSQNYSVH